MIKKSIKYKKAQHEAMGFVLIVALVSIIIVIFLSLSIGKGDNVQNSIEISNLLQSSIYFTSDCAVNFPGQYQEIQELVTACYKNPDQMCLNGKNVCEELNQTFKSVIEQSLRIDESSPNKAYKLNIYASPLNNIQDKEQITYIESGVFQNCKSRPGGIYPLPVGTFSSSTINIELELCAG